MKRIKNNPLAVILFTVFLDMVGIGILIPVIPILLASPTSQFYLLPTGMSLQTGYILLGFLIAIYPFFQFLSAPILGQLSDRVGRKKVLVVCLTGTAISYVIFAIAILTRNIPLLFVSRAFDGITGGNISVAQAAIADITPPEKRSRTFGLIGAAFGFGFIIGPFIGGVLADPKYVPWFNAATPFWFAAVLSAINIFLLVKLLPETREPAADSQVDMLRSVKNITKAFSHPDLRLIFLVAFMFQAGFSFLVTFFGVFLIDRFAFTQGDIGMLFAYIGIWIVFAQVFVTNRLSHFYREYQILRVSLVITGIAVSLYFFASAWWMLLLIAPIMAIFNGVSQANLPAIVSRSADKQVQGQVLGLNTSVQALAQSIPPVLSGVIAASVTAESPLIIASAVIITAGIVFITMYKPPASVKRTETLGLEH